MVKKDECEFCGSEDNLEVHHLKMFKDILSESLHELKLDYKDTNKYTKSELSLIVNIILGKHLGIEYYTLCKICHKSLHSETWDKICNNDKHKQYYEMKELKKQFVRNKYNIDVMIPYLNTKIETKLYRKERDDLIKITDIKDTRGRPLSSYTYINTYFYDNNIKYKIESQTDYSRKLEDGSKNPNFEKVYWIIHKI